MQQRFCECGHPVLVAYVITKKGILPLYQTKMRMKKLMCCPVCGRHIDINDLR